MTQQIVTGGFTLAGAIIAFVGVYFTQRQQRARDREADARQLRDAKREQLRETYKRVLDNGGSILQTLFFELRRSIQTEEALRTRENYFAHEDFPARFRMAQVEMGLADTSPEVADRYNKFRLVYAEFTQYYPLSPATMEAHHEQLLGLVQRMDDAIIDLQYAMQQDLVARERPM